jgi:hypothetical protein
MSIEIVPYSPEMQSDWNAFVQASKTPNFLFDRNYLDYHSDRFVDSSLVIYKHEKVVALFPCNKTDDVIASHGGLTYGGLVISADLHSPDVLLVLRGICDYFRNAGVKKIIYKAVPSIFNNYPAEEVLYGLTQVGAKLWRRDLSSVVELSCRPKLSDSRKNTSRKASKAGARVVLTDDLVRFHALLTDVLKKFDAQPVHSLSELTLLKSRFPDRIFLFATVLDGEMLAGSLVYDFGHVAHTQYLAVSDYGRKIGALDYLLMTLIEETFVGRRYFSFGISTEQNGTVLNEGLIRQKEGFGARGIVHDFYEIDL